MSDQDVINLSEAIANYGAAHQTHLDQLEEAKDYATQAGKDALDKVDNSLNRGYVQSLFFDAVNGDDELHDGGSEDAAYKTWAKVISEIESGRRVIVNLQSDMVADARVSLQSPPSSLTFRGKGPNGSIVQRVITFAQSNDNDTLPGGMAVFSSFDLITEDVSFILAHSSGFHAIECRFGRLELKASNGTISRTGTGGGSLFRVGGSAHFEVNNIVIDQSASGYVIQGVAGGGDPNDVNGLSANFNQA